MEAEEKQRGNTKGPTSRVVAAQVRRLRQAQGLDLATLAERLKANDWPIPIAALSRLENGHRRIDVDDLVALAIALDVNPNALLINPTKVGGHYLALSGAPKSFDAIDVWAWAAGERPLDWASAHRGMENLEAAQIEEFRQDLIERFQDRVSPGFPQDPGPGVTALRKNEAMSEEIGHRVLDMVPVDTEPGEHEA